MIMAIFIFDIDVKKILEGAEAGKTRAFLEKKYNPFLEGTVAGS